MTVKTGAGAPFAVVFDMDGVLIDSVEAAYRVRQQLLAEHGVDLAKIPDPHGEAHKGSSARDLLTAVEHSTGVHIDEDAFVTAAVPAQSKELQGARTDPDLAALLEELERHGIPCAVASGGREQIVRRSWRFW
jgi:beta-phosphoglucomutase-like phosphatase (HAD superfamily)